MSRIQAPAHLREALDTSEIVDERVQVASQIHEHTYGITSDPLTQFACVFAALIHDVGHGGVPNAQLVKEKVPIAAVYRNQSVAEQNSVDVAWTLMMDPAFDQLRETICVTQVERARFRQLVVNSVMATDIVDKQLKALRNARWEKAFGERNSMGNPRDNLNRKATIVIEHLIQASDIAHTMQHWHIYRVSTQQDVPIIPPDFVFSPYCFSYPCSEMERTFVSRNVLGLSCRSRRQRPVRLLVPRRAGVL